MAEDESARKLAVIVHAERVVAQQKDRLTRECRPVASRHFSGIGYRTSQGEHR